MTKIIKTRHEQIVKACDFQSDFLMQVAKGNVPGHTYMAKFGAADGLDTTTPPCDMWEGNVLYSFPTAATIDTISCGDAAFTASIVVIGLDENWDEVTQVVTLDSQNKVTLSTPLIRSYRMYNASNIETTASIYLYQDDTITGGIPDNISSVTAVIRGHANQTEMCVYTVPRGYVAFFLQGYVGMGNARNGYATFSWRARPFGGVFLTRGRAVTGATGDMVFIYRYAVPVPIPEKTDVITRVEGVTVNDTDVIGGFDLLLVDTEFCQVGLTNGI